MNDQDKYIESQTSIFASIWRPDGKKPTPDEARRFTIDFMRQDCVNHGWSEEELDTALRQGKFGEIHQRVSIVQGKIRMAQEALKSQVVRFKLLSMGLAAVCVLLFLSRAAATCS